VGTEVPEEPLPEEPLAPPVVEEGEPVVTVAVPLVELTELMMTAVVVPLTGTVTMGVLVTGTACTLVAADNYTPYEFNLPTTLLVMTAIDVVGTTVPEDAAPDEAGTPDVAGGAWIWPSLMRVVSEMKCGFVGVSIT
jgi:hypothetical protein